MNENSLALPRKELARSRRSLRAAETLMDHELYEEYLD